MKDGANRYLYRVDAADTITFVSPQWLRFAQDNDAAELTQQAVIGKSIWRFIAGQETRTLYVELFRRLRARASEIALPFQCDSPAVIRHMSLTLRSLGGGGIECEGVLLKQQTREPISLFSRWATRSEESIPICSSCRRLFLRDAWVEVSVAVVRKSLFAVFPLPQLDESLCPACRQKLAGATARSLLESGREEPSS